MRNIASVIIDYDFIDDDFDDEYLDPYPWDYGDMGIFTDYECMDSHNNINNTTDYTLSNDLLKRPVALHDIGKSLGDLLERSYGDAACIYLIEPVSSLLSWQLKWEQLLGIIIMRKLFMKLLIKTKRLYRQQQPNALIRLRNVSLILYLNGERHEGRRPNYPYSR